MKSGGHGQSNYSQVVESPPMDSPTRESDSELELESESEHVDMRSAGQVLLMRQRERPPPGQWRDGICSWANNLWPSCVCSFFVCCGGWITGQIAQASGYQAFHSFVTPYLVAFTVLVFLFIVTHNPICLLLLWLPVFMYALFLRLHFTRKHEITQHRCWQEVLLGVFCCPCSLAQMARHSFGYRLVFDGDARSEPPVYYSRPGEEGGEDLELARELAARGLELTEHETPGHETLIMGRASHEV